jgi:Uma2 family endonuclease
MSTPLRQSPPDPATHVDQRVRLHGIAWKDYEAILAMRGESAGVRITYLDGELELMTPSLDHEAWKTRLARLIEAWAEERGVELEGYGSWTVRSEAAGRGVEADECYVVGVPVAEPKRPDIAIEVIRSSGGIDKLEVYRGLGVPEVWFYEDGTLRFHLLRGGAYIPSPRSARLADLEPTLIARFMAGGTQSQAVKELRAALRDEKGTGASQ